jgi:hypothetical protein
VVAAVIAAVLAIGAVAYAATTVQADLDAVATGYQKTVDLGTLAPSTAQSVTVYLIANDNGQNLAYPFDVTGSKVAAASTFAGATEFTGVTIGAQNTYYGGQVTWTTPAAESTAKTYYFKEQFATTAQNVNDGSANVTITFTIAAVTSNHAPTVSEAAQDASGAEGSTLETRGAFYDQDGDTLTITLVSGVGSVTPDTTGSWSWSYDAADNGSGTVVVRADDGKGGTVEDSFDWSATNVAPTVSALTLDGATGIACKDGNTVGLSFSFSDPGVNDNPWHVDINWGDGSADTTYDTDSQGAQASQSHTYGVGTFTVGVSVTDKDGGVGTSSSAAGAVSFLYRLSAILPPFNADGTSVWKYGSTLPVKVQITWCDGTPVAGLAPKVGTSLVSSTNPALPIDEAASTSAADTTGIMRYDGTSQYIYNFGSKNLSDPSAVYYMTVKGTDSNGNIVTSPGMVQVKFGLKTK